MTLSGNFAVAMSTLTETSTTKPSRQGSSSHQQLSVHIDSYGNAIMSAIGSYVLTTLTCALA